MDTFTAFVLSLVVVGGIGYLGGRYAPLSEVKNDCGDAGEVIIQNTVIKCKPVASIVNGKRIEFKEADNEKQ